jgi:poly(hydroxyalkanoate) depolymerase family esterase
MRLARFKSYARTLAPNAAKSGRLRALRDFSSNPGNLNAWFFAPAQVAAGIPLVVVLHGCTQSAHGYDIGSGWSQLAEAHGFAVLYPEQQRANNANLCFNWFEPSDTRRRDGEVLSIAHMIDAMIGHHGVDRNSVFITGLSAGGAMTSAMLASYPEKFAGGAILAGLPHGAASSMPEAFQQMQRHNPSNRTTGASITRASGHRGAWPVISIWHGTADTVVHPSNADAILKQWLEVQGLNDIPTESGMVDGHPHRAWRDTAGRLLVEEYRVTGMGHGVPLSTTGVCGCGEVGAFMLEVGISSTIHSAREWGLLGEPAVMMEPDAEITVPAAALAAERETPPPHSHFQVGQVIEQALRSAGLMK